jgi:hypothetical protein
MRNFVSYISVLYPQIKTIPSKSPNHKKTCFLADFFCYAKIKDKSLFVEIIYNVFENCCKKYEQLYFFRFEQQYEHNSCILKLMKGQYHNCIPSYNLF